ncbi:helix-turn-helix domain-containing protein [Paenibacillus chitinolyticus]
MQTIENDYLSPSFSSQSLGWENLQVTRWSNPEQANGNASETRTKHLIGIHCSAYYENYYTIHIIPRGEPRLCSWGKASLYFLQIEIPPSYLERVAREAGFLKEGFIQLERKFYVKDPKLLQLGLWMLEELQNEGKQGKIYSDSLSNMLAVHLLSHYSKVSRGTVPSRVTVNQEIFQIVEYMKEHLNEELSLQELADRANLSLSQFMRLFKQQTGHTPHNYLIRLRIERSKTLICRGDYSLREIADRVGFADQGHFSRMFKRQIGMTPKQYTHEVTANPLISI